MSLPENVYAAIDSTILRPSPDAKVVLHEPTLGAVEQRLINECLASGFVSSVSPFVTRFENELSQTVGTPVVACTNGTAALHICCRVLGVDSGDEVLLPALTFIATPNSVTYAGATPHFVDCCPSSLGVDPVALRRHLEQVAVVKAEGCFNKQTQRRIKALIVVHLFGHAARIEELQTLCEEFKIELIEDAAESLGSTVHGRSLGTFSKVAATSFNGNKIITTGGGGAIFCRDAETAMLVKHLTTTAKKQHAYLFEHDMIGYNYRMPGLNAALGCAQMTRLEDAIVAKRRLADAYARSFASVKDVQFFREPAGSRSNYWLNLILLKNPDRKLRDDILKFTNDRGIMTRPAWTLMNKLPMYRSAPRAPLTISEQLEEQIINLPSSPFLAKV